MDVLLGVSRVTAPPRIELIAGLTFATVTDAERRVSRKSWNRWDVINSGIVLLLILAAYLYFIG